MHLRHIGVVMVNRPDNTRQFQWIIEEHMPIYKASWVPRLQIIPCNSVLDSRSLALPQP